MDLRSKVEINKEFVEIGTRLYYIDCENYISYLVIDVDDNCFECIDEETKENEVYFFNQLQHGWNFVEILEAKEINEISSPN